jgi:hypothetical protein
MGGSIRLSQKHGVNPSIQKCFICGKDIGLVLFGKLKDDTEAPKYVQNGECDKCKEAKKKGVFILAVRDGEIGENPYRTGQLVCVKEEAFRKMCTIEIPAGRLMYMHETPFMEVFGHLLSKEDK